VRWEVYAAVLSPESASGTVRYMQGVWLRERDRRVEQLRQALARFGCERALLFGSAARGDVHEGSDLDVLVVKRTDLPFVERPRGLYALLAPGLAVDAVVYTPEEFSRLSADPRGVLASALADGVEL
jgi:predicted nucleotidyltransferase